jgi:hypothetical protein
MADVKKTVDKLDKLYSAVSDALAKKNTTYNVIKQKASSIENVLKAKGSDDEKLKGLVDQIDKDFTALHTAAGAFIKAKEEKFADVDANLKDAFIAWRAVKKSIGA